MQEGSRKRWQRLVRGQLWLSWYVVWACWTGEALRNCREREEEEEKRLVAH